MKTLAFIPVRGGSKSIPLKNIKEFCSKPLCYWTIRAAAESNKIDRVVVATDSDIIAKTVTDFGFDKVEIYRRNPDNAKDTSSTESVMLEFIEIDRNDLDPDDIFVLIQATSPLTQTKHLDEALTIFGNKQVDSMLTCSRTKRFFWGESGIALNYNYMARPRRQDFKGTLMENGAFYINTIGNILETGNRLFGKIGIYEMPEYCSIEIDEPDDWFMLEKLMKRHILNSVSKPPIKLLAVDVDGVLTDSGMYYTEFGDELKKFNTRDGKGFELVKNKGIITAFITGENNPLVERRAHKLKIDYLHMGASDKVAVLKQLCTELNITLDEVAFMGDDLGDLNAIKIVGLSACPADAIDAIKQESDYICSLNGGQGCVREFIENKII